MNIEEYKQKRDDIELNATKEKNSLIREFAMLNNNISIGDVIQDHIGKGLVEGIAISAGYFNGDVPHCVYRCLELTLKGVPKKRAISRNISQTNINKQQ